MKTTLTKFLAPVFILIVFITHSFASENDLNSAFNTYQKNYQAEDFAAAKTSIEEALQTHTNNSYLIYNLGLTEYKLGKAGLAIGLWRKALSINPSFNEARQAIEYASSHLASKPLTKDTDSTLVWLEKLIVEHLSFNYLWPAFLLSFFLFGFQLIRYLGAKKKAFANDEVSPTFSSRGIIFLITTLLLGAVSFFSYSDLTTTKATAVSKATEIKTGPNDDFATLFEVPEGTEVLIRDKENDWYKVEDPNGRIGWTKGTELFVTNQ